MKWIIGTLVLLFAIAMVAQQQGMGNFSTQPTMSNSDVRYQIQSTVSTSPDFSNANISATVSDNTVTLYGYVMSKEQHDEALALASSYAGDRQILDQIQVGGLSQRSD